jgi:hypothetical protein
MNTKKRSWTPPKQVCSQRDRKFGLQYFLVIIIANIGGEN